MGSTVIFLCIIFVSLTVSQDCAFKARGRLVDQATFLACSSQVRFNASIAAQTLDTLMKSMPSYAFIDAVKDSPIDGFQHFEIDILDELQEVAHTAYDRDADFQQDVSNIFLALKDPHTLYTKPRDCYSVFALQPLSFSSAVVKGKQIIFIDGIYGYARDPLYKDIPFPDLLGAEVKYIDEQPALEAIFEFAKDFVYISKDNGTCFTSALQGGYQQRPLVLMPTPLGHSQHIEVAFANGTFASLHIPWGFFFTADTNYTKTGCRRTLSRDNAEFRATHPVGKRTPLTEFLDHELRMQVPQYKMKAQGKAKAGELPDIAIHNVSADVLCLQITTFEPSSNADFLKVVSEVVALGSQGNVPYLILDVRGNGGGDICLGYQVISSLITERNPIGHYDIKENPLIDALVSSSDPSTPLVGANSWLDENGNPYQTNAWYTPPQYHVRGGVNGTYSSPSYLACDFQEPTPQHLFQKIIVLSDGLCGSTCAVFTSHLNEIDHVETAVIGGILNQGQQSWSFPGGLVLSYDALVQLSGELGVTGPFVPNRFPNSAGVRFAWLEIYPWRESDPSNVPLEFLFVPADHRIPLWTSVQADDKAQQQLYLETAKLFRS